MKLGWFLVGLASARLFSSEPDGRDGTGAYTSFDAACNGCKDAASQSCTKYLTSVCYAGNVHSLDAKHGNKDKTDKHEWHWTENAGGAGDNYRVCFPNTKNEKYLDNFGDKYDPNDSKFVECTAQVAR